MPIVDYLLSAPYRSIAGLGQVPAVNVVLHHRGRQSGTIAALDSGSPFTLFNPEHAALVGIEDVTVGDLQRISTLGGVVDSYFFDLEMEVHVSSHRSQFPARVGFFVRRIPRNILGRNIFFARYEVGFRESQQIIHIRPEA